MADTIQIQGTLIVPTGGAAPGGLILVDHLPVGTATADAGATVIASRTRAIIGSGGAVDFGLIPNDLITTPSGASAYRLEHRVPGSPVWRRLIVLDSGGDDPIDLGDLTEIIELSGQPVPVLGNLSDVHVPSPNDDDVLFWNDASQRWEAGPGGGGGGGANDLDDLSDVVIAGASDGHVLQRAGGSFVNQLFRLPPYTSVASLPAAGSATVGLVVRLKESSDSEKFIVYGRNGAGSYVRQILWSFDGVSSV